MGEEQKKGQEEAMKKDEVKEDEERVEEREVNKGVESPIKALNEAEIEDDTQETPLGTPTLAKQTKLVDVVIKDTVEKALKYTQVDKEMSA